METITVLNEMCLIQMLPVGCNLDSLSKTK